MRVKRIVVFLFLLLFLSACGFKIENSQDLEKIYKVGLETILETDEALNFDMDYIAIDIEGVKSIDKVDKLSSYFEEKYEVEVMYSNIKELESMGLYNTDTLVLDGVLIKVEEVRFKFNKNAVLKGFKYRDGNGAIGVEVELSYDEWEVVDINIPWVS